MITCLDIADVVSRLTQCENTGNGIRLKTTCTYPSFEVVTVLIRKFGDGFIVTDGGESYEIALSHGQNAREVNSTAVYEAKRFGIVYSESVFHAKIESVDWLDSAILCVANAASISCLRAVEKSRNSSAVDNKNILFDRLRFSQPSIDLIKDFEAKGDSGRNYKVDVALLRRDNYTFYEMVSGHQSSINSKFVLFSDIGQNYGSENIAVHENQLSIEEQVLLQSVASLISLEQVGEKAKNTKALI